ncbi:MAG: hypothetical protein E4H20_12240 [Spirochaetales bacterium]|nr:MAG: hypothetical protein E4H20_12240 [Spirochaetales bacterium]
MKSIRTAHAASIAVAFALLACFLGASCSDALLDEMGRLASEANRPVISPSAGSIITAHETITLSFDSDMDSGAVSIGGDIGLAAPATTWADPRTLDLNQANTVSWSAGTGKKLTVSITESGQTVAYEYTFEVFNGVCVSSPANAQNPGAPGNAGTVLAPLDTIQAGIDMAYSKYSADIATVKVAVGSYAIAGTVAVMKEKISLKGGYSASFMSRNYTTYETVMEDTRISLGTDVAPLPCVDFAEEITSATVLEGFSIKPSVGAFGSAIYIADASPAISYCTIFGKGRGSTPKPIRLCGIEVAGGSPSIQYCTVLLSWDWSAGNTLPADTIGIYTYDSSSAVIEHNTISGGYGADTYAVNAGGLSDTISLNIVTAGNANNSTGSSYGIYCDWSSPNISGNTIDAGSGIFGDQVANAYAIWLAVGANPSITGNEIRCSIAVTGEDYAIYEASAGSDPSAVSSNSFSSYYGQTGAVNRGYYYDFGESTPEINDLTTSVSLSATSDTLESFGNTTFD